jgi:phosphoribosylformylglycinamidine synthase
MQPNINSFKEKYLSILKRDPNPDEIQLLSCLVKMFADNTLFFIHDQDDNIVFPTCPSISKFHAGKDKSGFFGMCYAEITPEANYPAFKNYFRRLFLKLAAYGAEPIAQSAGLFLNLSHHQNKSNTLNNLKQAFSSSTIPLVKAHLFQDNKLKDNGILSMLVAAFPLFSANPPDRKKVYKIYLAGQCESDSNKIPGNKTPDNFNETLNSICTGNILFETLTELITLNIAAGIEVLDQQGLLGLIVRLAMDKTSCSLQLSDLINRLRENNLVSLLTQPLPYAVAVLTDSEKEKELLSILSKRNISYIYSGITTTSGPSAIMVHNDKKSELPLRELLSIPFYQNKKETASIKGQDGLKTDEIPDPDNIKDVIHQLVKCPELAACNFFHQKLDAAAGSVNMNITFPSTAGVVKLNRDNTFVLTSMVSNQRFTDIDFHRGIIILIAEAARNILCAGGVPQSAIISVFSARKDIPSLLEQVNNIKSSGEKLNLSTSVCFRVSDNYTGRPLVVTGLAGTMKSKKEYTTIDFKDKGQMIYLIGESLNDLNGSEYIDIIHRKQITALPAFDLRTESKLHKTIRGLTDKNLIMSANNISKGGLFFSLLQSALVQGFGFDITSPAEMRLDTFLFSESGSRVMVTVAIERETEFIDFMMQQGFPFSALGHVTKEELRIDDLSYGFIGDYAEICLSVINNFVSNNDH